MALTEREKLKLARILRVTYVEVNDKIFNLGTNYITAEVETQLQELIAEWDGGAGRNNTKIRPREANFGAEIDPGDLKSEIRTDVARLLYFSDMELSGGVGNGQFRLVRG